MEVDYSFKILEAFLMAKPYKSREEVIKTSMFLTRVAFMIHDKMPADWSSGYNEALRKLSTLSFGEMKEIIGILRSYNDEDDDCDYEKYKEVPWFSDDGAPYKDITGKGGDSTDKKCKETVDDHGEEVYNELYQKGIEQFEQKNYPIAASCFRSAADKGNAKAQYNYALCLYSGHGVRMDRVEAIKRFVSASQKGIEQADRMLQYIGSGFPCAEQFR